jgi:triphosphoribosyl-dephospho-CoA synthetase
VARAAAESVGLPLYNYLGGVNAHKGAIFSMGLLCGAAGRLYGQGTALNAESLLNECAALAEYSRRSASPRTAGERFYQAHGVGGIRGASRWSGSWDGLS